jgi:hypothetical protein
MVRLYMISTTIRSHQCQKSSGFYFSSPPVFYLKLISKIVNELARLAFPGIVKRYEKCAAYMEKTYDLKPGYGLFWNFCINTPDGKFLRIHCRPHVDAKNLALGICALYIWGR